MTETVRLPFLPVLQMMKARELITWNPQVNQMVKQMEAFRTLARARAHLFSSPQATNLTVQVR